MTIRSPAKLGALSHRSLPRPQSPQIGPECGSNPDRACQTRAQDDVVHVAAPACGCSANHLNISSREDRCCFLRCYRNPDMHKTTSYALALSFVSGSTSCLGRLPKGTNPWWR